MSEVDNKYKGYRFQMLDHNWFLTHPGWQLLTFVDRGIYMELRLLAGRTRQETGDSRGHISIGLDKRGKRPQIEKWLAAQPGISLAAARASMDRLREHGFIKIARGSGIVTLVRWADEQGAPPSSDARRKRKSRTEAAQEIFARILADKRGDYVSRAYILDALKERVSGGKKFAEDFLWRSVADGLLRVVDGETYFVEMVGSPCTDAVSPSPSPPSTSIFEGVTIHTPEGVTSHNTKIEKDMNISSKGRNPSRFSSGGEGEGETLNRCYSVGSVDRSAIWEEPPLDVCERLVGSRNDWNHNTLAKSLRDLRQKFGEHEGTKLFRQAMEQLWSDLRDPSPKNPIRVPSRVLQANLQVMLGVRDDWRGKRRVKA